MSLLSGKLYHPLTKSPIIIYSGFSWPNFFLNIISTFASFQISIFWFFYKGMYLWAFISLIISWYTSNLSGLVFPFFVNDLHRKHLLGKGYYSSNDLDDIKTSLEDLKHQVKENMKKDEVVIETINSENVDDSEKSQG